MEEYDQDDNSNIKDLRDAAERGRKAVQELDDMKREVAFLKAGVDMETKAGQLLFKAYDGDLDKDFIRAEAEELGAIANTLPSAPTEVSGHTDTDRRATTERQNLARDTVPPETTTESPYDKGHREFRENLNAGRPTEDAAAGFVRTVIEAASAGDRRVIFE